MGDKSGSIIGIIDDENNAIPIIDNSVSIIAIVDNVNLMEIKTLVL